MPVSEIATFNPRHFFTLAPEALLAVWGLLLLLIDLGFLRGRSASDRKRIVGGAALLGAILTLAVSTIPLIVRFDLYSLGETLNFAGIDRVDASDPVLFFGSLAGDMLTDLFNLIFSALLILVVWMSTSYDFTEDWGEYFALILWSTVGMMLLTASEEFLVLFLTLEMMTICLYLATAFEKSRKRSAEGGLKYFVYGSVSSALFLFGLSLIYGLTGSTQFYAIGDALRPSVGSTIGLSGNVAGATAVLLVLVGFGFKVAAVPFHQWAPDAYEGAPAPVAAWVATGSKIASFIALMKVLLHALGPWSSGAGSVTSPGWIGVVAVLSAASMTYGNLAAIAQKNFKRMLAYSSIAHAGYMLVGVAAAGVSSHRSDAAGSVLFYLVIYAFTNVAAFAIAAWMAKDKGSDQIDDLNGLASAHPALATCIVFLMLSLIGMPPLAGFFGKLSMFMEALDETNQGRLTLIWLVALGLLNSVISAFYYVRVLKAMFLRPTSGSPLGTPPSSIAAAIVIGTVVALGFGIYPAPLINIMRSASVQMLAVSNDIGRSGLHRITLPAPSTAQKFNDRIFLIPAPAAMGGPPPARPVTPPAAPSVPKADAKKKEAPKAKAKGAAAP